MCRQKYHIHVCISMGEYSESSREVECKDKFILVQDEFEIDVPFFFMIHMSHELIEHPLSSCVLTFFCAKINLSLSSVFHEPFEVPLLLYV